MTLRRRNLIRHQPDQWASDHERARYLAALRLTEPLEAEDDAWLTGHLDGCEPCRIVGAEYEAEQAQLKALPVADPPRDLWARTQAALEAERRRSAPAPTTPGRPGRLVLVPVMASLAVAFSVLSVTFLSSQPGPAGTSAPTATDAALPSVLVAATPMAVAAADVSWVQRGRNGGYELIVAPVTEVCEAEARPDCPALSEPVQQTIELPDAPQAVLKSPADPSLVVVQTRSAAGIGGVYVVAPEGPSPSAEPTSPPVSPSPTAEPTAAPTPEPTPEPSPGASGGPAESPVPSPTASPAPSPTSATVAGLLPIATDVVVTGAPPAFSIDGAWLAFSARPADGTRGSDVYVWKPGDASARQVTADHRSVFSSWAGGLLLVSRVVPLGPDPLNPPAPAPTEAPAGAQTDDGQGGLPPLDPGPSPTVAPTPAPTPTAPAVGGIVIGQTVVTVSGNLRVRSEPRVADDSIRYEPLLPLGTELRVLDGPTDGSGYVWYKVEPVSSPQLEAPGYGWVAVAGKDGAPWIAPAGPARAPILALPQSVIVDPVTGLESLVPADGVWRPVLDPRGQAAVYWRGTLEFDAQALEWRPGEGTLAVGRWAQLETFMPTASPAAEPSSSLAPSPGPSGEPTPQPPSETAPAADPTSLPTPTPPAISTDLIALYSGDLGDWDVAWSDGGSRFALWVGDPLTPDLGMLSLYAVDPLSGVPLIALPLLDRVPALHGFSLSDDRLAWAAPPGQDGEGSRLLVLAWRGETSGQVESEPLGEDSPILVVP